ncbi:MAG TPA: DUF5671 domain-containing protein [Candidatus Paceibacterota bacterium]|nr:DUF5671 domain-containing protein [Candidatus Paceibacterota bacterium]
MDKPKITPKDFFLWAGAMISLYVSVFALVYLLFDYIDRAFPDALNYSADPYGDGIRYWIASLVVLFPVYLLLTWVIRRDIAHDASRKQIWVRRWALVLTLFIAGASLAIDLIAVINTFLGGEITMHFILKALVVLLIGAGAFMHFLADLWGYWDKNPRYARSVAGATALLIVCTIGAGFFIIGSPWQIRLYRFDDQKVNDLQGIQSQVVSYWQHKNKLPQTLTDLNDSISGYTVPSDPQTGAQYEYKALTKTGFALCANFNAETRPNSPTLTQLMPYASTPAGYGVNYTADSWYHGSGRFCFPREVDPSRYPQIKTAQ